jgi:hypothetical protein
LTVSEQIAQSLLTGRAYGRSMRLLAILGLLAAIAILLL